MPLAGFRPGRLSPLRGPGQDRQEGDKLRQTGRRHTVFSANGQNGTSPLREQGTQETGAGRPSWRHALRSDNGSWKHGPDFPPDIPPADVSSNYRHDCQCRKFNSTPQLTGKLSTFAQVSSGAAKRPAKAAADAERVLQGKEMYKDLVEGGRSPRNIPPDQPGVNNLPP